MNFPRHNGGPPKQIVAMGGGGFSQEPDNPLLDRFVLDCARAERRPRVCFLGTASDDAQGYVEKFMAAFGPMPCVPGSSCTRVSRGTGRRGGFGKPAFHKLPGAPIEGTETRGTFWNRG